MFSAASVTGDWAERAQPCGAAMIWSTEAAKPAAVHGALLPQAIPSSTSTRYLTSVVPDPTTPVLPPAAVNVPAPRAGVPSSGAGPALPPMSAPAVTAFFSVVAGLGVVRRLGPADGDLDGDSDGDGLGDGSSAGAAIAVVAATGCGSAQLR